VSADLLYAGLTQDRVPVGIRERVQADTARRRQLARSAARLADGVLLLSTCERFEVYASARTSEVRTWINHLAHEFGFSADALAPHLRFRHGDDAARHMLRVAAGLESRLLGEPHILRQVRATYLEGLAHRELGPVLSALGRAAVHTGRRVRRETSLAAAGGSLMTLALERLCGGPADSLRGRRVIVLGTGMLAREAVDRLVRSNGAHVTVVSRVFDRAAKLAQRFGADAAPPADLAEAVRSADALLACSAAVDGFLVDRRAIGQRRRPLPMRIVDLGIPRNIDPDVASLAGVQLVHLEGLHAFAQVSPVVIASAEAIVARELERFNEWQCARRVASRIAGLTREGERSLAERRALHAHIARLKAQVAA
jgi:glutamyl-tRNA reductase